MFYYDSRFGRFCHWCGRLLPKTKVEPKTGLHAFCPGNKCKLAHNKAYNRWLENRKHTRWAVDTPTSISPDSNTAPRQDQAGSARSKSIKRKSKPASTSSTSSAEIAGSRRKKSIKKKGAK